MKLLEKAFKADLNTIDINLLNLFTVVFRNGFILVIWLIINLIIVLVIIFGVVIYIIDKKWKVAIPKESDYEL